MLPSVALALQEQKKKELEDLDAVLAELGLEAKAAEQAAAEAPAAAASSKAAKRKAKKAAGGQPAAAANGSSENKVGRGPGWSGRVAVCASSGREPQGGCRDQDEAAQRSLVTAMSRRGVGRCQ